MRRLLWLIVAALVAPGRRSGYWTYLEGLMVGSMP